MYCLIIIIVTCTEDTMKTFALHAIQAKSYHMLGQRIMLKDKIK